MSHTLQPSLFFKSILKRSVILFLLSLFSLFAKANTAPVWQYGDAIFVGEAAEQAKLLASDGDSGDYFGGDVAIDNGVIVVGARSDQDSGQNSGSVYIFTADAQGAYNQVQKLVANDGASGDNFGGAIAIDNGVIVIGASGNDGNGQDAGSVYVFSADMNGFYSQSQKMIGIDVTATDYFGESVAIDNGAIVVGAFGDDDNGQTSGSAYVFTSDTEGVFSFSQKLRASDGAAYDYFGGEVAIDNGVIVIGASGDDDNGLDAGSLFVFTADANGFYSQSQKLTATDDTADDNFGASLAMDNGAIVVGASFDDDNGTYAGSAYIFAADALGAYSQVQKLTAGDAVAGDYFGRSVAIDNGVIVVGADGTDDKGLDSGSVYIFAADALGAYSQVQQQTADDGAISDYLGRSVAINNGLIVAGASWDDDSGVNSGSSYVISQSDNYALLAASLSVIENLHIPQNSLITKDFDGDNTLSYILSGDDAAEFKINTPGQLSFINLPDYEVPSDADTNNIYQVTLTVSDGQLSSDVALTLTVLDSPDTDLDGIDNNLDGDDDGDGYTDADELANGTDSLLASSIPTDNDGDFISDLLDNDDDNDGALDVDDAFPIDASENVDTDGDGVGNNADIDDDNDGLLDLEDICPINSRLNSNGTTEGDIESFQYCISNEPPPKMHFELALSDNFSNAETIQILYWLEGNEQHWITLTRDPETGFFITEIELNEYAVSGSYNLRAMRLTDNQNNEVYLNESQINLLGFNTSVGFYNPVSDSEKPYVTSLMTLGWSINNNGEPQISFTVFVGDDLSGVKDTIVLELNSPTGTSIQKYGTKVDENTYSFDFVLNQYASSGIYPVNTIRLYDNAGNSNLSQDWIADNLEGYELTNPNSDNVASSLSYISLEAKFDEQSDRPILAVNGLATDDFSGVANVYLRLTRPSNDHLDKWQEMDNGDNVLSRTFSSLIALPQIYEIGEYKVDFVRTNDFAANEKTLSKADIDEANQSSITTINLYYPDDEVSDSYEIQGSTKDDFVFGANRSNDHLIGLSGNDYIFAGDGDDHVEAGEGDDLVIGGSGQGDDTYEGDEGFDTLVYTSAKQPIIVDFINGTASGIDIDSDTFTGFEKLIAGQSNDVIITDENINVILGYDGDDIIVASAGDDELTGGNGKDEFVFRDLALATLASYTTIIDYQTEDSVVIVNHDSASNLVWNTNLINTVTTINVENELYFTTDGTDGYLIVTGNVNAKENSFVVKLTNINSLGDISILSKSANDVDEDGQYNYFDSDDDNDGYSDADELANGTNSLLASSVPPDNDGDFISDLLDTDDDNDGYLDADELANSTDSLLASSIPADNDGDFISDLLDNDDDNDGVLDVDDAFPLDPTRTIIVKNDIDGDGKSDLLWRSSARGWNFLWAMDGVQTKLARPINVVQDDGWLMAGQGDYDGDGKSDILWRNTITGLNFMYLMDGLNIKTRRVLNYVDAPQWELAGSGDFNGDGKGDVLWQDVERGRTQLYLMDGLAINTNRALEVVTDLNEKIVAVGDVNGDGTDDVIWRNQASGTNSIWLMQNGLVTDMYVLNRVNVDWTIAGSGDLDGDGTDDIVLRNQADGRNWAFMMENGQIRTSQLINTVGSLDWQIANIGDYDGDGKTDFLWRNEAAARNIVHLMDGLTIKDRGVLRPTDNTWTLAK
jgi:hypothetical protein